MEKIEAVKTLKATFEKIIKDSFVTQNEINEIQQWLDDNAVMFCNEEVYNSLVLPIQGFIDNGDFSVEEIEKTKQIIDGYLMCDK